MKKMLNVLKREKPKWALVLMGGGARGLAHIGVLVVLQRSGLIPDVIVGTSMGGIIGGLFAQGFSPPRLKEIASELSLHNFIEKPKLPFLSKTPKSVLDYLFIENYKNRLLRKMGLDKEDSIETYLKSLVGEVCIEDMSITFACNAVDLISGREIIFEKGKLYKALRATMSLPLVFEPARIEDMMLLDGAVLDNAPVEIAKKLGAKITILVDIHRSIKEIPKDKIKNTFQLIQRMTEITMSNSTERNIKNADFILRLDLDFDSLDFSEISTIIREGEKVAGENMQSIKKTVG